MIDRSGVTHWGRIIAQPLMEGGILRGITGLIGDITDWKRTEDLLRASELQYTAVVQDLVDLICRFRPDLTITFVNPAYCRFYRRKEQDLLDQGFLSFIPEKSQETTRAIIASLTPHNPVKTSEFEILGPDGVTHWHHMTIRGIFDEQGEITEFQSSSRDLTELRLYFDRSNVLLHELQGHQSELEVQNEELKKLRAEAQRSEQKYLDLYNFAPVGYFTLDADGKIIEVNQTGSSLLGISRHQLMNASFQEFIAQEHRAEFDGFCTRISESSRKQTCEVDLVRDGEIPLTLQIEGKAMEPANGDSRHYRIIIIDVTERKRSDSALKESESRLRAIIHGSPNPHYVIDKNHKVIYWNRAMSVSTGIKAKDIIGTSNHWMAFFSEERPCMADLLVDGTPEKIARWFPDAGAKSRMAEGAYEAVMYFPELGKSGKWFHFTAAAIRDAQDVIIGALETVNDITDLRLAEESAKNANKKLNMLNSVTRHDIINEMTIWSGYMDLLEIKLPENPEVQKQADRAKAAARAVERLIAFTRDYQNLGVEPASWHVIDDLVTYAAATANLRDIDVALRTNSVKIFADPLIKKVFFNLIDNSLRHGGHVTKIGVFFRELHDSGVIIVEDNGVGIPAAVKTKLFRRGFGKHTGFGLYLSKEILTITGISIQETGEPGKGARFEMVVPKDAYRF
jgi:PAS domain S-box-containing protein